MAEYQHASDWIPGTSTPYSGVIRTSDGKFIPCQATAESQDWADYLAWAAVEGNVTDPYLAPEAGGAVLTLEEGEEPVGTMNDSLPLVPGEPGPPVMVDVPYASGTGTVGEELACTMGNWDGEPRTYDYRWLSQLVDPLVPGSGDTPLEVGTGDKYVVAEADVGRTIACTVTATNEYGSTRAPVSNGIVAVAAAVVGAETAQAEEPHRRSHHRKEEREE